MSEKDPRLCPGCERLGTPQHDRGDGRTVYQCERTDGCTYDDAWHVDDRPGTPLPTGVEGPDVPARGDHVDVTMDECPSCGWCLPGDDVVKGVAWLIRTGPRRGFVCVHCRVCYMTMLGDPEGMTRASDPASRAGVAGATDLILAAVERSSAEFLCERFIRVSVAIGKREIREDVQLGHVPRDVASFGDLHDHRDANEYGGLCNEEYCSAWEIPKDLELKAGNKVQGQLDAWIREGGLR